jgi:hypothetical protein
MYMLSREINRECGEEAAVLTIERARCTCINSRQKTIDALELRIRKERARDRENVAIGANLMAHGEKLQPSVKQLSESDHKYGYGNE